ncbi:MAG: carboxy terminal-processing peptidase [Zoogloea sp.]|uniref:carboxy terminal-processing peptidase n=1 Tax=Zoogloea sp. TaxID=49181 RepID=UPI003F2AE8E1
MRHRFIWAALAVLCTGPAASLETAQPPRLAPTAQQSEAAYMSARILDRYHYRRVPLDDAMSVKIFDRYLKALDPEHLFFTQADVDGFAQYRTQLDDAILQGQLRVPFLIFDRYETRVRERLEAAKALLNQDFDFTAKESYAYQRDKAPWPKTDAEVQDLWRKRVKNDWLRLRLAGKDDKAIRETLAKRYDNYLSRATRNKSEDVFQIFMNAYAMSIEPHTNYLGVSASTDFDISMRLSLVGIGAILQERDDYIVIRELVPGGPAALSGQLAVGDRIVGVAQGKDGALVDVIGSRVDEAVKLIRGEKESTVVLDVLPADSGPDGKHKRVQMVRAQIKLEEQAAQKKIIEQNGHKVGVITLPTFYEDFEGRRQGDADYRSASRDVSRLINELKAEKIEGLIFDLRNNGGGSLRQAVELTGLFIDKGPVVQQKRTEGKIDVESDTQAGVLWDGPMAVMINRSSASASEIMAAALQDYGRAVIVGEGSFGKGTVQTLVSLDQLANSPKPVYGELKMTVAQFFRVNGGTTQLKGVTPDIRFPTIQDEDSYGESSFDNALPWVQIPAASYSTTGSVKDMLATLNSRYHTRIARDKDFLQLQDDVTEYRKIKESKTISLNEAERRKEKETQEARLKARDKDGNASKQLDDGLQAGERSLAADLAAEKAYKARKDVLLDETARIVMDQAELISLRSPARTLAQEKGGREKGNH